MAAIAAILDFGSEQFKLFSIYKSPWCFLPCFESIGLSVQEKKWKIDFQDGHHGSYLGSLIGMILAIFDLQITQMLPTKSPVDWPFVSGEVAKNRFSRWPHLGFPIGTILAIFYLLVTPMLPTKFQVNWPFGSGEEAKNRFSRWPPWQAILDFQSEWF